MLIRIVITLVNASCLVSIALGEIPAKNPPTRAAYDITWNDFDAQHSVCNTVCTKTETSYETTCTDSRVCVQTRIGDPNVCVQYQNIHQCFTDPIDKCVQTAQQCHVEPKELPDSDLIQVTIEENAPGVSPAEVEFRLTTPPNITFYKGICVSDGTGAAWYIENYGQGIGAPVAKHEDHVTLWATQVKNGQPLIFAKAGFLGIHKNSYALRGLEKLKPGSRVTFFWYRDKP